jgi:hypothetical protein
MSSITKNILRAIDYDKVAEIRKSNWQVLGKRLDSINGIKVKTPSVPFMYPLYLGDKAEIVKRHLIENKIYIATLWPNVCSTENKESWAYKYASGILPLPLDQRYDVEDMEYIAECILSLNF